MAFDLQHLGRWSVSMNLDAPRGWGYDGLSEPVVDTIATILTPGYFNSIALGHLRLHDKIQITATDAFMATQVVAVDPDIVIKEITGSSQGIIKVLETRFTATTPAIQVFPTPGIVNTDFVFAQTSVLNSGTAVIIRAQAGTNEFTIEFDVAPGVVMDFSALIIRAIF